jgi:hypothetical protein
VCEPLSGRQTHIQAEIGTPVTITRIGGGGKAAPAGRKR